MSVVPSSSAWENSQFEMVSGTVVAVPSVPHFAVADRVTVPASALQEEAIDVTGFVSS